MAWLSTWAHRIEFNIDYTKVDSPLSNFPIMVYISADSGTGNSDLSIVFDRLTSDANRKKIAITTSDGTTQCYVEIEDWSDADEKAWLWTKVPTVASGTNTTLYLYYDSTRSDNITYVGDTTDTAAQSVWDSSFEFVIHMAQDPNGDAANCIKDSTSNVHHFTPVGGMTTADLIDGKVGKALNFDGGNDFLIEDNIPALNGADLTLEFEFDRSGSLDTALLHHGRMNVSNQQGTAFRVLTDGRLYITYYSHGGWRSVASDSAVSAGDNSVVYVYDHMAEETTFYFSGVADPIESMVYELANTTQELRIAAQYVTAPSEFFNSDISEVRVSTIQRSASWVKATHNSNWDSLVSFGTEEEGPAGWTGTIIGITNPTKIMGIPTTNISKVNGIASS